MFLCFSFKWPCYTVFWLGCWCARNLQTWMRGAKYTVYVKFGVIENNIMLLRGFFLCRNLPLLVCYGWGEAMCWQAGQAVCQGYLRIIRRKANVPGTQRLRNRWPRAKALTTRVAKCHCCFDAYKAAKICYQNQHPLVALTVLDVHARTTWHLKVEPETCFWNIRCKNMLQRPLQHWCRYHVCMTKQPKLSA